MLITYGGGSVKTGVLDQVYSALEGLDVREFGGIEPNPSYETLMSAVKIAREENITFLLAVGGVPCWTARSSSPRQHTTPTVSTHGISGNPRQRH